MSEDKGKPNSGASRSEFVPSTGIRLLLVVRDPQERAELRQALSARFAILEASNAEEGLRRLSQRYFSVILTDYALDDRDGGWLLSQVARRYPHTYRFLMSDRSVPGVFEMRDAEIIWMFFPKPLDPAVFSSYFALPSSESADS